MCRIGFVAPWTRPGDGKEARNQHPLKGSVILFCAGGAPPPLRGDLVLTCERCLLTLILTSPAAARPRCRPPVPWWPAQTALRLDLNSLVGLGLVLANLRFDSPVLVVAATVSVVLLVVRTVVGYLNARVSDGMEGGGCELRLVCYLRF